MIAGVLLAAGRSSRFGGDKLLAMLGGRSVIERSATAVWAAVDELLVVMPVEHQALESALTTVAHRRVMNPDARGGMASSIACGIAALPANVEAAVIALGDQPLVRADVVRQLVQEWRASGAPVVAPHYRDGRGHPVVFGRECFGKLRMLEGDRGAAAVIQSVADRVRLVRVDDDAPVDVDTPEALAALARDASRPDS